MIKQFIFLISRRISFFLPIMGLKRFHKAKYGISNRYIHRIRYRQFDATHSNDDWQLEVYQKAREIMLEQNFSKVFDIGCGSGYKLIKYLGTYDTIGSEVNPAFQFLNEKYPNRKWIFSNFDINNNIETDLIICADVIEHLSNPDVLLNYIKSIKFKLLIISTPARDLLHYQTSDLFYGPPCNSTHMREWTFNEFEGYISNHFEVINHIISNQIQATQMIICKKNNDLL